METCRAGEAWSVPYTGLGAGELLDQRIGVVGEVFVEDVNDLRVRKDFFR